MIENDGVNDGSGVEVERDDKDGKMAGLGDDLGVRAGMNDNDQSDQSDNRRKWSEIVTGVANDGVMGAEVINDIKEGAELGDQDERMKDDDHGVGVGMNDSGEKFDDGGAGGGPDAQDGKKDGIDDDHGVGVGMDDEDQSDQSDSGGDEWGGSGT